MNKIKTLAVAGAVVLTAFFAQTAQAQAQIEISEKTHDFGTIYEADGNVSYEFKVTNTGDKPLLIGSFGLQTCACIRVDVPEKYRVIAPNKSSYVKVIYAAKGRLGKFSKQARFSVGEEEVTLTVSGNVLEGHKPEE